MGSCPSRPKYFGPYHQIQNSAPETFSPGTKVSKKVCHTPVGQKLRQEIDCLETGYFWPGALPLRPADLTTLPKNYFNELDQS